MSSTHSTASLPIFLGAFDEETSAAKIIAEAEATGDAWVINKNAGHSRWPAICGHLEAELQRVCAQLHELQHRPGETKTRANRKRLLREAMSRRAA